jgi:hypothetical protein
MMAPHCGGSRVCSRKRAIKDADPKNHQLLLELLEL